MRLIAVLAALTLAFALAAPALAGGDRFLKSGPASDKPAPAEGLDAVLATADDEHPNWSPEQKAADVEYRRKRDLDARGAAAVPDEYRDLCARIAKTGVVSREEFVDYLRCIEAMNPRAGWATIVTVLHKACYNDDTISYGPVSLFKDGGENAGARDLLLPNPVPPMTLRVSRTEISLPHVYAGIRSLANRNAVTGLLMGIVNTDLGDDVQIATSAIKGTARAALGKLVGRPDLIYTGIDEALRAGRWKPKDQSLGNTLGMNILAYLTANRNAPLSEAAEKILFEFEAR